MRQSVLDAVDLAGGSQQSLSIVDVGGGTGGDAVRLAELGHRVTVVDPSPDALAALQRRAADAGFGADAETATGTIVGVLGDTGDLHDHVADDSADLVVCHGVLEVVDEPAAALSSVARVVRPGGYVSTVVAGRRAAVVARALAGDFSGAQRMYTADAATWDVREHGPRRFVIDEIDALLRDQGFRPVATHALRIFADLVPSALVDIEPGARDALFELERLVRDDEAFTALSVGLQSIACLDLT